MKKSLLLIASVVMSTATAFAQWVKPVPEFSALADDGETIQYLYNVEYEGFLLGANDWNTRASLSKSHGLKMKFKKNYSEYEDEIPVEESFTGYSFLDSCETGNKAGKWSEYDCQGYDNIWCDGDGRGGAGLWIITALGDNKYQLTNENVTDADGKALLFGWSPYVGDANNNRCWMLDYSMQNDEEIPLFDSEKACTTWAFVSAEAYAAWETEIARYDAAEKLIAYVNQAEEECPGIDLSPCHIIYNNTQSTLEDLERSYGYAEEIVGDWKGSHATVKDPQDVTIYIENPTFDVIGDFHGWNGSSWGAGGSTSTCAERYEVTPFDTWQDVNHGNNIPNGIYKLSVYAFYRYGSTTNDWDTKDDPSVRHAKLYAKSGEDSLYVAFPSLSSWATDTRTDGVATGDGLRVPNSMVDFVNYKEAGLGKQISVYVPVENGQLRVGAAKKEGIGTDWAIVDDFSLMYFGNSDEAYAMWRDAVVAEAQDFESMFDGVEYYYKPAIQEFKNYLDETKAAISKEDIKAHIKGIPALEEAALASITAYEKFLAKSEEWIENINNNPDVASDEWDNYCDFVQSNGTSEGYPELTPEEVLEACSLTADEIDAYIETVDAFFHEAIAKSLKPGDDCTNMLVNASFADGFNGWTRGSGMTGDTYKSTDGATNVVECYGDNHGVLDIYQIVTNVPDGVYSLTCQAFVRPGGNGSYTGDEATNVFLYMNDYKTEVMNIVKDALPADENAVNKENCYIDDGQHAIGAWPLDYEVPDAGYVPNSLQGASYAFKAGRYTQEAYGFVEGGTMKIGLTSNGVRPHWCLWANFKLTYLGKDAISIMLEKKIEDLNDFLEEKSGDMTEAAVAVAEEVKTAAEGALDEGDADEMKVHMENINQAIADAEANVKALATFNETYDTYMSIAEDEELFGNASESSKAAYEALIEELPEETADLTTEDLNSYTEQMEIAAANLRLPEYEGASASNPIDFTQIIVNPSFETGDLTGWTAYQGSDTGAKDNSNATYTVNNADRDYVFNTWSGSAPADGFWVAQSFKGTLPKGKYELTALLAADQNSVLTLSVNDISVDFTMINDKGMGQDGTVAFEIKEPMGIEIKVASKTWFKTDNFRLQYFGAANISVEDITALIDRYLDNEPGVTIEDITNLIDDYLNQ